MRPDRGPSHARKSHCSAARSGRRRELMPPRSSQTESGVSHEPQEDVLAARAAGHETRVGSVDGQLGDHRGPPAPSAAGDRDGHVCGEDLRQRTGQRVAVVRRVHGGSFLSQRSAEPLGPDPCRVVAPGDQQVRRRLDESGGPAHVAGRLEVGRPPVGGQVLRAQPARTGAGRRQVRSGCAPRTRRDRRPPRPVAAARRRRSGPPGSAPSRPA